jgi:NAD+ diphosphatase
VDVTSFYLHCPKCGQPQETSITGNTFACVNERCKFARYFNPACAVVALISRPDGKMLFIIRAKEPSKGMLGLPGGFIDFEETAESAVRREIREEVDLHIEDLTFVCSQPNSYTYRGVTYQLVDFFFAARLETNEPGRAMEEVSEVRWLDPKDVDPEELAFPSMRVAFRIWRDSPK